MTWPNKANAQMSIIMTLGVWAVVWAWQMQAFWEREDNPWPCPTWASV